MLAVVSVSAAQAASELNIEIELQPSFGVGEQLFFTYSFNSKQNQTITYIPYIDCPRAPVAFIETERADLEAGISFERAYYGIKITEDIEPQTCLAYIQIIQPREQRIEREFKITTKPSFDFHLLACQAPDCQEKTKVYQVDESFYLSYAAEVEEPEVSAKLIYPNKREQKIELGKSISLPEKGIYFVEATADIENYKTMQDSIELWVVGELTAPIDTRACNANGACQPDSGETPKNCPEDCPATSAKPGQIKIIAICLAAILGAITAFIIYFYFLYFNFRRKVLKKFEQKP